MIGHDLKLNIIAPSDRQYECDELVRLIGDAVGDREIPAATTGLIAQAVAIIVMYPEAKGRRADVVFADAEERWATHPMIARERRRMTIRYGYDVADEALRELHDVGQSILAALGTRHLPDDACNLLGVVASDIADHKTGVGA